MAVEVFFMTISSRRNVADMGVHLGVAYHNPAFLLTESGKFKFTKKRLETSHEEFSYDMAQFENK